VEKAHISSGKKVDLIENCPIIRGCRRAKEKLDQTIKRDLEVN